MHVLVLSTIVLEIKGIKLIPLIFLGDFSLPLVTGEKLDFEKKKEKKEKEKKIASGECVHWCYNVKEGKYGICTWALMLVKA